MPATTIDEVVQRLQDLDAALEPADGVRWFNRLYLEVTLAVREYCRSGVLTAPPFLEELDVRFANRYLAAVDAVAAGRRPARCWAPMFEARADRRIAPLQFALAGMNAHIGHDLALSVVDTCEALGVVPEAGPERTDYDAVNPILGTLEAKTKAWLLTGAVAELDRTFGALDDQAAIWSIEAARDAAWVRSELLWQLRDVAPLREAYLDTLDGTVGMECRALLLVRGL